MNLPDSVDYVVLIVDYVVIVDCPVIYRYQPLPVPVEAIDQTHVVVINSVASRPDVSPTVPVQLAHLALHTHCTHVSKNTRQLFCLGLRALR